MAQWREASDAELREAFQPDIPGSLADKLRAVWGAAQRATVPESAHGTERGYVLGCRCDPCMVKVREVWSNRNKKRWQQTKAEEARADGR